MSPEAHEAMQAAWEHRDAELLASHADAEAYHADWRALLEVVRARGGCDALIVDAPYSERTHSGHDDGTAQANRANDFLARKRAAGVRTMAGGKTVSGEARAVERRGAVRRTLNYAPWTPDDVDAFVDAWSPLVRGWIVSITDHVLARAWGSAMEVNERYVFSPIACVEPGSRVRMTGDGPSQWSCWAVVSRPRTVAAMQWRALPGAYVVPDGHGDARSGRWDGGVRVVGGKPLWLMESLVRDYSRPGDLVVDPCCGAGTTLVAAQRTGRRSIGGDAMREHAELAAKRISRPAQRPLFTEGGGR